MSVIVGIAKDDEVYMGCDAQITNNGTKIITYQKENFKIWHPEENEALIVGTSGTVRESNIVRSLGNVIDEKDILNSKVNIESISTKTLRKIIKGLQDNDAIKDDKPITLNNQYLIAYKGSLYQMGTDGSVIRIDDFGVIGSGAYEATSILSNNKEMNPDKRIIEAIKASITNDIHCDYPIILTNTKATELKIIDREGVKYE